MNVDPLAVVFYLLLGIVIYLNRKKIEIVDKIFIVFRWKKGAEYIKRMAKPKWLIKLIATISIPICLYFMGVSVFILFDGAKTILSTPNPTPTVSLAIPGVKIPGSQFYIPLGYGIISIVVIMFFHELSHGLVAVSENIKIKSTGTGLFLFLPLAFVEPDEKSLNSAKPISKIRMFFAGSFANIVVSFLSLALVIYIVQPWVSSMINYNGILIEEVMGGYPASFAGIPNGTIIYSINGTDVSNMSSFIKFLSSTKPNSTLVLNTSNGTFMLTTVPNPDNNSYSFIGVKASQSWEYKPQYKTIVSPIRDIPFFINSLLLWISNLSLAVGIINLLPLWITDGGKVLIELLSLIFRDKRRVAEISNIIFSLMLGILLFDMFGPYFM